VYGKLASELPKQGVAVLLAHYPSGAPLSPLKGGIEQTVEHVEALLAWAREYVGNPQVPVAMVGWSMGGAVVIEVGARAVRNGTVNLLGVATIASMKEVSIDSPRILVQNNVDLLLMHNVEGRCTGVNSKKIAKLTGGKVEPLLFPGENHGVKSAFGQLRTWLPTVFSKENLL
jgi:alpha-beta hydrolase superfamily lysophospholipase